MKIIAKNLVKVYNDRTVVNDVSFEVNKGEVVGFWVLTAQARQPHFT